MTLYSVTFFDREAPNYQYRIALWANERWLAQDRGLRYGQVIDVTKMTGAWPLDATRRGLRRRYVRES